jgi:hypothetical protein
VNTVFTQLAGGTIPGPLTVAGLTVTSPGIQTTTLAASAVSTLSNRLALNGAASGTQSAGPAAGNILTPANTNGVAAQLTDTSRDYMVYLTVGTAGTAFTVAIGPTASPANTVVPSGTATSGEVISFRLPNAWFWQWSATTATLAAQTAIAC